MSNAALSSPGSRRMDGNGQGRGAGCGRLCCSAQVSVLWTRTSGRHRAHTRPSHISHGPAPCFLAKPNVHSRTHFLFLILFKSFIFILFFWPHMWDLSSLTRARTLNPYIGSMGPLTTGLPGQSLFLFFFLIFHFIFLATRAARRMLVPWARIKPTPPALEVCSLNHWTARKVFFLHF